MTGLAINNPRIQRLRRLIGRRSSRHDERCFVIEGPALIDEDTQATDISSAPGAEVLTSSSSEDSDDAVGSDLFALGLHRVAPFLPLGLGALPARSIGVEIHNIIVPDRSRSRTQSC